jgi:hypothetical protein
MKKTILATAMLIATAAHAQPATCPDVRGQLAEYLAAAKQREARDGSVSVTFTVAADGKARVVQATGTRAYLPWVHNAVDSLDCKGGATSATFTVLIRFSQADTKPTVALR